MKLRRTIAGIIAATALLAGCAQTNGTAAIVNGVRISQKDLGVATEFVSAMLPGNVGPRDVLIFLMNEVVITPILEKRGDGLSDEEVIAMINQQRASSGKEAIKEVPAVVLRAVRFLTYRNTLSSRPDFAALNQEIIATVKEAKITMNPRYGSIDEFKQLNVTKPPWIARK